MRDLQKPRGVSPELVISKPSFFHILTIQWDHTTFRGTYYVFPDDQSIKSIKSIKKYASSGTRTNTVSFRKLLLARVQMPELGLPTVIAEPSGRLLHPLSAGS